MTRTQPCRLPPLFAEQAELPEMEDDMAEFLSCSSGSDSDIDVDLELL